jgi:hypothetical protein
MSGARLVENRPPPPPRQPTPLPVVAACHTALHTTPRTYPRSLLAVVICHTHTATKRWGPTAPPPLELAWEADRAHLFLHQINDSPGAEGKQSAIYLDDMQNESGTPTWMTKTEVEMANGILYMLIRKNPARKRHGRSQNEGNRGPITGNPVIRGPMPLARAGRVYFVHKISCFSQGLGLT